MIPFNQKYSKICMNYLSFIAQLSMNYSHISLFSTGCHHTNLCCLDNWSQNTISSTNLFLMAYLLLDIWIHIYHMTLQLSITETHILIHKNENITTIKRLIFSSNQILLSHFFHILIICKSSATTMIVVLLCIAYE